MFTFPPTGTAEKWGCVCRLVLAGTGLTFALWWVMVVGSGSLTANLIPALAGVTAGLLVWDAATWQTKKPGGLYLILPLLYKLALLAGLLLNGRPVGMQDSGVPLMLTALMVFSFMDDRRERADP